jgi:predicted RNase H-like nuclease (RuvC/YqgF family)
LVGSKREMSKEELVDVIRRRGKPSLLACDVNPAPDLLLKLASYFNTRIFIPERDMGDREKSELVRGMEFSNEHEMDAAAAAMKAFRFYENKLRQIDKTLRERGLSEKAGEIKHLVLNNTSLSNALLMVDIEREIETPVMRSREETKVDLESKNRQIKELLDSNIELRKAVERLEEENAALGAKIRFMEKGVFERLAGDREMRKKEIEIMRLRKAAHSSKSMEDLKKPVEEELRVNLEGIIGEYRKKHKDL